MNPFDELNEMRQEMTGVQIDKEHADNRYVQKRALEDAARIDPNSYHRSANGLMEMSSTYQPNTLINIGGAETTVESAIAAGLVTSEVLGAPLGSYNTLKEDHEQTHDDEVYEVDDYEEDSQEENFDITNLNQSYSSDTRNDLQFMDSVLGNEGYSALAFTAFSEGLDGSEEAIDRLVAASGMNRDEVLDTALNAIANQATMVADSFETLTGYQIDYDHLMSYLTSSALSNAERQTLRHAMSVGNGAMLGQLAAKYAQYNNWN
ncbi:hypothetical protein ACMXYQ_05185 [Neptuniibacter sp. PT34_22]|uniref:hypothetical protein n=1 Tax=Neptuniibacter sp. PT34_22 TaxID=3398205 RepID=UPI0039F5D040